MLLTINRQFGRLGMITYGSIVTDFQESTSHESWIKFHVLRSNLVRWTTLANFKYLICYLNQHMDSSLSALGWDKRYLCVNNSIAYTEARVLIGIHFSMCIDKTLVHVSFTCRYVASLKDCNHVSEYEIHTALDITFSVNYRWVYEYRVSW